MSNKRVNNKKNKRKKNNKKNNNNNNQQTNTNTNTANSSIINNNNNEMRTVTSLLEYFDILLNALDEIDVVYTNTTLNEENFNFNEKYKQVIINVIKRKSDNPEHLFHAKYFSEFFNNENGYWDVYGRTNTNFNLFNRIYYNEKQFQRKKAIYPISFESLFHLYNEYNVYSEVVLMVSELLPSKIEFSRYTLFGKIIDTVNLGPLQKSMEIPLEIPSLKDYLNRYSFFLVIIASNQVFAFTRPFSLHRRMFESDDNLMKLTL